MTGARRIQVQVCAPARLHLGFLDLHGGLGRRFGSIGLGVDEITTEIAATRAPEVTATGPGAERARWYAQQLIRYLHLSEGARLELRRTIPEHAGLGSGTQMALAVGTALCRLYGLKLGIGDIAAILLRGHRSGIGIGAFSYGGFVVDAGRGPATQIPPIVSQLAVPEAWRFLLVLDRRRQGLSGAEETEAFARLNAMPAGLAAEACRIVLVQVLPALVEADCTVFGAGISRIQEIAGDYFAPVQGGRFNSPKVHEILSYLRDHGAAGIGQSSWGPTGFALFASETMAFQALRRARARWHDTEVLDFVLCRAKNAPAEVRVEHAMAGKSRRC